MDMEKAVADKKFHLRVLSPLRVVFDKPVDMVIARTTDGDMGVLYDHEACSALLDDGALRIIENLGGQEQDILMVLGGFITVRDNEAVVMSEIAEYPDELQGYLDRMAEEREQSKRDDKIAEREAQRIETAIRNTLVQIDVSPYSVINRGKGRGE